MEPVENIIMAPERNMRGPGTKHKDGKMQMYSSSTDYEGEVILIDVVRFPSVSQTRYKTHTTACGAHALFTAGVLNHNACLLHELTNFIATNNSDLAASTFEKQDTISKRQKGTME
eukprot:149754_1